MGVPLWVPGAPGIWAATCFPGPRAPATWMLVRAAAACCGATDLPGARGRELWLSFRKALPGSWAVAPPADTRLSTQIFNFREERLQCLEYDLQSLIPKHFLIAILLCVLIHYLLSIYVSILKFQVRETESSIHLSAPQMAAGVRTSQPEPGARDFVRVSPVGPSAWPASDAFPGC